MRQVFGRFAPNAMATFIQAHGNTEWSQMMSTQSQKFMTYLGEFTDRIVRDIPIWALDPINWYSISSKTGSFELQSEISSIFPCAVFDNIPLECSSRSPEVRLENIDEILRTTGIYQAWRNGNFGENGKVSILDTGISKDIAKRFHIESIILPKNWTAFEGEKYAVCEQTRRRKILWGVGEKIIRQP